MREGGCTLWSTFAAAKQRLSGESGDWVIGRFGNWVIERRRARPSTQRKGGSRGKQKGQKQKQNRGKNKTRGKPKSRGSAGKVMPKAKIALIYFCPLLPAAAARGFLAGSGFFNPSAMSASSSRRDPVGVAPRSFHARSPFSPLRFDFGAIQRSSAEN